MVAGVIRTCESFRLLHFHGIMPAQDTPLRGGAPVIAASTSLKKIAQNSRHWTDEHLTDAGNRAATAPQSQFGRRSPRLRRTYAEPAGLSAKHYIADTGFAEKDYSLKEDRGNAGEK
jgi:hypothetical protein